MAIMSKLALAALLAPVLLTGCMSREEYLATPFHQNAERWRQERAPAENPYSGHQDSAASAAAGIPASGHQANESAPQSKPEYNEPGLWSRGWDYNAL
jgi:hypothetical protein